MTKRKRIVVVGHGMVGHRFAQAAVERGLTETHDVVIFGEEPRAAYDRVGLTSWFGQGSEALSLLPGGEYDDPRVRLVLDSVVTEVDRDARTVTVVSPPSAVGDLLANPGAVTVRAARSISVTTLSSTSRTRGSSYSPPGSSDRASVPAPNQLVSATRS